MLVSDSKQTKYDNQIVLNIIIKEISLCLIKLYLVFPLELGE